ncbi:MAG: glycosyltransferase family 9 protein [Bryobacteraceae bacterium]|jgi:ADP-heptose:LPS heptosyltransferase
MKVLVYRIGSLGDTIVSIPALRAVRAHFGRDAHIAVLHNVSHAGLVTTREVLDCAQLADEFIPYQFAESAVPKVRTAFALWARLLARRFDAVVSLLPSERPPAALRRDVWFFRTCGIPRVIGFRAVPDAVVRPRENGRALRTQNEARILLQRLRESGIDTQGDGHLGIPLLHPGAADRATAEAWMSTRRKHPERPLIAVCPGCKKPANSWPLDRFIELSRRILATNCAEILVLGGPAEQGLAEHMIAALGGEGINAAGDFSVAGSVALLSHCQLLVGLDTGTSHLAAAVGVPCVVIQSANSFAGHWDPLGDSNTILRRSVPCEACLCSECPVAGHPCMEIPVDEVWQAVEPHLERMLTAVRRLRARA